MNNSCRIWWYLHFMSFSKFLRWIVAGIIHKGWLELCLRWVKFRLKLELHSYMTIISLYKYNLIEKRTAVLSCEIRGRSLRHKVLTQTCSIQRFRVAPLLLQCRQHVLGFTASNASSPDNRFAASASFFSNWYLFFSYYGIVAGCCAIYILPSFWTLNFTVLQNCKRYVWYF